MMTLCFATTNSETACSAAAAAPAETLLINGRWQAAAQSMAVYNPFDGELIQRVACAQPEHVEAAIAAARKGLAMNRALPTGQRARLLQDVAALVARDREAFAGCISRESGKPVTAARLEVDRCVNTLRLAAEEATRLVGETINFDSYAGGESRTGYYVYEPIGIVVAITPFNDPLNLVAHKLGPAIAAGNAVILKPSEQAPLSALKLAAAFIECGLPAQILSVLTGYGSDFGTALVGAPEVSMVSFTGGEKTGNTIARQCGIKRLAMELGANSPVIVSACCQLSQAVEACVSGAFWASGQNCIGVQRVYVHRSRYDEFSQALVSRVKQLVVGDPALDSTDVGPIISGTEVARVANWVQRALEQGGQLLCGGQRIGRAAFAPTVIEVGERDVPIALEEVFGPVVSLHSFVDFDQAIAEANRSDFMIHAAIFTDDLQEAMVASRNLDCSGVMINDSTDYRHDAMPFGGAKRGAMGREGVKFAMREMVQTKTVCVKRPA